MDGVLLIDKPMGWTSFDVVNKVRSLVETSGIKTGNKKRFPVGHTGTLDPLATGLLVLLLGSYTKQATTLSRLDKTYEVVMHLGQTSTTGDNEGQKTLVSDQEPTKSQLIKALKGFIGVSEQVPPAYSAIKINGKRAYSLARAGLDPKMSPRPITIYSLDLTEYLYPSVSFTSVVSSGTYIRSLVEDIGKNLGTGAYLEGLRRTSVGVFTSDKALNMNNINIDSIAKSLSKLDRGS